MQYIARACPRNRQLAWLPRAHNPGAVPLRFNYACRQNCRLRYIGIWGILGLAISARKRILSEPGRIPPRPGFILIGHGSTNLQFGGVGPVNHGRAFRGPGLIGYYCRTIGVARRRHGGARAPRSKPSLDLRNLEIAPESNLKRLGEIKLRVGCPCEKCPGSDA